MEISGEQQIPAPPASVWAALNDAETLRRSIPGCETLDKKSDTEMAAKVTLKIGPVKATFSGEVELSNLNPPRGYTISGQGNAGPAGGAKGGAEVELLENNGGTLLRYKVTAQVSGKIAQLGGRLIDATAKKLAKKFFANFANCLAAGAGKTPAETPTPAETHKKTIIAAAIIIATAVAAVIYFSAS